MYDVIVIGGGPAGIAAALSSARHGAARVLVIERDRELGGVLHQCSQKGYGLQAFGEDLTGPEYARRLAGQIMASGIEVICDASVLEIDRSGGVACLSPDGGYELFHAKALVLATGCRERTRGETVLPGDRVEGVMTAGAAQRMMHVEGWRIGERIVILGSYINGMMMARRLTQDGIKVVACVEPGSFINAPACIRSQCIDDTGIPLYLHSTITNIRGRSRVEEITISKVDAQGQPIPGSGHSCLCDTVLISAGFIPEAELAGTAGIPLNEGTRGISVDEYMQTAVSGIFACGNVVYAHGSADQIMEGGMLAGASAASYVSGRRHPGKEVPVIAGKHVAFTVPQRVHIPCQGSGLAIRFQPDGEYERCRMEAVSAGRVLASENRTQVAPGDMPVIRIPCMPLNGIEEPITVNIEMIHQGTPDGSDI